MASTTVVGERDTARRLIDPELYEQLVDRIVHDEQIPRQAAEQAMDEGLRFLRECADHPGERLSPSPAADVGWHTFILFTRLYAEFCDRGAGRFIHHVPGPGGKCMSRCSQCHAGCHDSP